MAWLGTVAERGFIGTAALGMVHLARSLDEALDVVERFV
jgi:hypothetical protein